MQVPQRCEVVDGQVEAAEAFSTVGTELTSEHEKSIIVHQRLLELPRRRVEVEACNRQRGEGAVLLEAAHELGVWLLANLIPAEEPLTGVGLEKPNEQ